MAVEGGIPMRIEAYTQVQQLYQNRKVTKTQQAGSVSHADQVQISSLGKDIQTAKAAVAAGSRCEGGCSRICQNTDSGWNLQRGNRKLCRKAFEKI